MKLNYQNIIVELHLWIGQTLSSRINKLESDNIVDIQNIVAHLEKTNTSCSECHRVK